MTKSFLAALLVSVALAGSASAATKTYTDFGVFSSTSGEIRPDQTENFSSAALGTLIGQPDRTFNGFTTTLVSTWGFPYNRIRSGGILNAFGPSNGRNLHVGLTAGETLTLTFNEAIYSFGALFAGVNNGPGGALRSTFTVKYADGSERMFTGRNGWLAQTEDITVRFFGIVSTSAFSAVTFTGLERSEGFAMDDVRWSTARHVTPVPVPASGLLLMGAMLVAGWFGRRRARA